MATMKEMAAEYRIASAKLAIGIKRKKARGDPQDEITSQQNILRNIRKIQRLLDSYYTAPRSDEFAMAGRSGRKRKL